MEVKKSATSTIDQIDFDNLVFGRTFTDHMIQCEFDGVEWGEMVVKPLEPFQMHPGTHVLHYGQAVFEGLKAYRTDSGKINLFRIKDNLKRLNKSAKRLAIPAIDEMMVLHAIEKWLELDQDWVPKQSQGSLYIRPFIIATSPTLRAIPSIKYRFMLIACPVGFYYSEPIRVKVETEYTRAAKGGVGYAKAAGNYAAAFMPTILAKDGHFDQLVWTDKSEAQYLEELGSANLFLVVNSVLYTPELHDSILAGITRDSVICLAKEHGLEVREEKIAKQFLVDALKSSTLECLFATGTAAAITFIKDIEVEGELYHVNSHENSAIAAIKKELEEIKLGMRQEGFGWNFIR